jgi:hypothetical protein
MRAASSRGGRPARCGRTLDDGHLGGGLPAQELGHVGVVDHRDAPPRTRRSTSICARTSQRVSGDSSSSDGGLAASGCERPRRS